MSVVESGTLMSNICNTSDILMLKDSSSSSKDLKQLDYSVFAVVDSSELG